MLLNLVSSISRDSSTTSSFLTHLHPQENLVLHPSEGLGNLVSFLTQAGKVLHRCREGSERRTRQSVKQEDGDVEEPYAEPLTNINSLSC